MSGRDEVPWARVEKVVRHVLEQPPDARDAALDAACGDDARLRREASELLAAEAASGSFMTSPVLEELPHVMARGAHNPTQAPDADWPVITGYRLLEHIGTGGMGSVYLSERDGGHFQERVAIKALRQDLVDASAALRFAQERQILAWLRHRNIATLLDGGLSETGVPYIVMEYVDGRPIGEHCDASRLAVDERLRLLLQASHGVGHAHRNQIVHRDLKPSNILVSRDGQTKLLDFGIAKLLRKDALAAPAELPVTRTAQVVMTPLYAAPEQIRGGRVGPASDVFSLGVVLYELLTGRHPFAVDAWSVGETERAILDGTPSRPSEAVTRAEDVRGADGRRTRLHPDVVGAARGVDPSALSRRLRGDLDAIVLKALSKEPEDRYRNADALARDLELHLSGRAVTARQQSRIERLVTWWQHLPARRRSGNDASAWSIREAGRQARRADAMMSFLARMFELAAPTSAGKATISAREMLDWAAEHADEELAGEPDALADILATLGRILHEMGDDERAVTILQRALDAQRRLYGSEDPRLIPSLRYLATAYQDQAAYRRAEAHFREALAIARAAYGERHLEVSSRLNDLAIVMDRVGELTESRTLYEESLAIKRTHLEGDDPQIVTNLNNLAVLLQRMGYSRESEHVMKQVLAARRRAYGDESVYVANALNNLMVAYRRRGAHAEAAPLAREAVELRRRLLGDDHPNVALSLFNLACVTRDLGRLDEALPMMTRAIDAATRARGDMHPDVAGMRSGLATLHRLRGRLEEAETIVRDALTRIESSLDVRNPQLANVQLELGLNLLEQARAREAEPYLEAVLATRSEKLGENNPLTAEARSVLGRCWLALNRGADARRVFLAAAPILERAWGPEHPEVRRLKLALEGLPPA